jgi:type I restriction enzyme M protein
VISLPAGVFKPYSGVKTAVLVFRRPPEGKRRSIERIWFYQVKNDGFDPDKIQGGGRPETPDKNDIPALLAAWKAYKGSSFNKAPGQEAATVLEPGSEVPASWWAPIKLIAENDFNLAATRYKPRVADAVVEEDPAQLIRDTLEMERDIEQSLEALLIGVEGVEGTR